MQLDAIEYPTGSGNYVAVGEGSGYGGLFTVEQSYAVTAAPQSTTLRNSPPLITSISLDGRSIPFTLAREASISQLTFQRNVKTWFDPAKGPQGARYLRVIADDGVTRLRIKGYLISQAPSQTPFDEYSAVFLAPVPWFEDVNAQGPTTIGASTAVSNNGTARSQVSVSLTATSISGTRYTLTAASGTSGVTAFPFQTGIAYAATTFVLVNGQSVRTAPSSFAANLLCVVDIPASGSTIVDVIPTGTITNPLAGTLDMGQISAVQTTNDQVFWNTYAAETAPERAMVWRPAAMTFSTVAPASWGYTGADSGTARTVTLSNPNSGQANNANCLLLDVGGKVSGANALSGLKRVYNNATGAMAFVRYRVTGQQAWSLAWSGTGSATITTAVDVPLAVQVVAGIEYTATTGTDQATLSLSPNLGSSTITHGTMSVSSAAQTYGLLNGTLTNTTTGQTVTFSNLIGCGTAFTLDTSADRNQRAFTPPDGPILGDPPQFSDPDGWLGLDPGANTLTSTLGGALTLTWHDGYL